jgi:hypothetical protein
MNIDKNHKLINDLQLMSEQFEALIKFGAERLAGVSEGQFKNDKEEQHYKYTMGYYLNVYTKAHQVLDLTIRHSKKFNAEEIKLNHD